MKIVKEDKQVEEDNYDYSYMLHDLGWFFSKGFCRVGKSS